MTATIARAMDTHTDDPLLAKMQIHRTLPVHESCRRLRGIYPGYPRVYGVAVLADLPRRQWWPLSSARTANRVRVTYLKAAPEVGPRTAARQLAADFIHEILGRMLPLVLLEGRAWDVGLENLWVHIDRDGMIDWAAITDPTLRVLPDDPALSDGHTAVVVLPGEPALTTWVAHRTHRSLAALFAYINELCDGAIRVGEMWQIVGPMVLDTTARISQTADDHESVIRRSQAILDALTGFGLPVRKTR